jgi:hypothetical protein
MGEKLMVVRFVASREIKKGTQRKKIVKDDFVEVNLTKEQIESNFQRAHAIIMGKINEKYDQKNDGWKIPGYFPVDMYLITSNFGR